MEEITARIKGLLAIKGKRQKDLAEYLGITPQSLQNKLTRGSFSAEDLIRIAIFTGVDLAYIERGSSSVVTLGEDCLHQLNT